MLALFICILYAVSDEVHQLFVPGSGWTAKGRHPRQCWSSHWGLFIMALFPKKAGFFSGIA
ncbi:MAG: VanZ family protein [Bacillota bacterium]|jgi:hypothetical protein